ncbi:unnamed protein product [Amoebophrya sp. A25]|nr:unnamed protein product [Amoebophrya sp. A25]|eukprot:GSA25T00008283001.1
MNVSTSIHLCVTVSSSCICISRRFCYLLKVACRYYKRSEEEQECSTIPVVRFCAHSSNHYK